VCSARRKKKNLNVIDEKSVQLKQQKQKEREQREKEKRAESALPSSALSRFAKKA
jgi:hypothetical protein